MTTCRNRCNLLLLISFLGLLLSSLECTTAILYTPSDDASWAIHTTTLSTLLGTEKQAFYDHFIEGCQQAVQNELEEGLIDETEAHCTVLDEDRLRRNRDQPKSMFNYTKLGYEKRKTPEKLFQMILEFYNANKHLARQEWETANSYQNNWDSPSTIVNVDDETLEGGGEDLKDRLWEEARLVVQEWVGQELEPVSLYGVRQYHRGSVLSPHVDRLPLVSSAIINVAQEGIDEPWVLEVYGHDGIATNVTMEPGDMVLYESHSVIHGRPFPLEGELYANLFVHFEPVGPLHPDDIQDRNIPPYLTQRDDVPLYIVPGSVWEATWLKGKEALEAEKAKFEVTMKTAAQTGDVDALLRIGEQNPESLHEPDENGWHPIHEAVRAGHLDAVKILLEHGADVNQETYHGHTPLGIALYHHDVDSELVEFLEEMGGVDLGPDL